MKPRSICKPPQYGSPESLQLPSKRWMHCQPLRCGGCAASRRTRLALRRQNRRALRVSSGTARRERRRPMTTCQRHVTARSRRVSRAFTFGAGRAKTVVVLGTARCGGDAAEKLDTVPARTSTARASGSNIRLSFTQRPPWKSDLEAAHPEEARRVGGTEPRCGGLVLPFLGRTRRRITARS